MHNPDPESLYGVFSQVIRLHYLRIHALLEKIGVYPGQPPVLFVVGKYEGLSQKELADKLNIKAATITVMLGRMEKAGLVERKPDLVDQRVTRVYLTSKGKELRNKALEELKVIEGECFEGFTPEEQVLLRRLFMQMKDNLNKVSKKSDRIK